MQLDRTEIVVRARSALELLDLSLQVLKRHAGPIAISSALIGLPLLVVDVLAVAWMLREDTLLAADRLDAPLTAMRWRHSWHLILLFAMQFPLVSLPTSIFLGNQIFYEPISLLGLVRRLWPMAAKSLFILGCLRLGLVGLAMELFVDRSSTFDPLVEFWFVFVVAGVAILFRALWPFAPEIIGLELCPLRAKQAGEITYATRSRGLHRYMVSENLARFMGASFFAVLMCLTLIGAQMFVIGASTGRWQWNAYFDHIGLPLTMWLVGLFMAVFRFLSYLDSRIRLEGWELELRLKAEAARMAQTSIPPPAAASNLPAAASNLPAAASNLPAAASSLSAGGAVANSVNHIQAGLPSTAPGLSSTVMLFALMTSLWAGMAAGQEAEKVDAHEALRKMPSNSWYDQKSDDYTVPRVKAENDVPLRTSGWEASPPKPVADTSANPTNWNWNLGLGNFFAQWFPTLAFAALATVLAIVLGILTYYALRNYVPARFRRKAGAAPIAIDSRRIADLPFEVRTTQHNPLTEAERLIEAERYDEAIVFLYGYMLLALDQSRKLYLQRGKTNRMYLRELRPLPGIASIVEKTMLAFEDVVFGKHSISRADFMTHWNQLAEFHRILGSVATSQSPPFKVKVAPA